MKAAAVGQVWQDWDSRYRARGGGGHLLITDVPEGDSPRVQCVRVRRQSLPLPSGRKWEEYGNGRPVFILKKRLRETLATGYRLVDEGVQR